MIKLSNRRPWKDEADAVSGEGDEFNCVKYMYLVFAEIYQNCPQDEEILDNIMVVHDK